MCGVINMLYENFTFVPIPAYVYLHSSVLVLLFFDLILFPTYIITLRPLLLSHVIDAMRTLQSFPVWEDFLFPLSRSSRVRYLSLWGCVHKRANPSSESSLEFSSLFNLMPSVWELLRNTGTIVVGDMESGLSTHGGGMYPGFCMCV